MTVSTRAVRSLRTPLFLFLLSFALLAVLMDLRINEYDEAILLVGGRLVADGAVPHRDFYANYGPAQFYVLAGLFKLFGPSFLAARIYDTLIRAAIVALSYRMLAPRARPAITIAATIAVAAWMLGSVTYLYPMFPTLLLALLATHILGGQGDRQPGTRRLLAAGAVTGLTALFRYDVGFFLLAAHALGLLVIQWGGEGGAAARLRAFALALLSYGAGTALLFLPAAALLILAGAGPGFVHDILVYSPTYYPRMRSLPFPGPAELLASPVEAAVYLPFAAAALGAATLVRGRADDRPGEAGRSFLILLAAVTFLLSLKGLVRIQSVHLLLAIVPATILLAFLVDRTEAQPRPVAAAMGVAALAALFAPALAAMALLVATIREPAQSLAGSVRGLPERGTSGSVRAAAPPSLAPARLTPDLACAAAFLRAHVPAGEAILSATGRHDKLLLNNIAAYVDADRPPATRWHHFDPGLQTRADVQRLIIAELETRRTRWVLRDASWDEAAEPNDSAISSGVHLLDRYLADRYRPVARFGRLSVLLAGREAPPGPTAALPTACP